MRGNIGTISYIYGLKPNNMKSLCLYITSLLAFTAVNGWSQSTPRGGAEWPAEPWTSATPVEMGREVARTHTIPYDSEAAALKQSTEASAYLQPLGESWKISTTGDGQTTSYEHSFKVPFSWIDRDLYLYVGSASGPYEVFVNGERIGYNQSAATAAEFSISIATKEDMNTLEIRVHGDAATNILENRQSGITPQIDGQVYIIAQPRVRVRDYVSRTHLEDGNAMIELGVLLKSNMLNPKTLTVHYALLGPDGETVTSGRRDREIDMRREDTVRFVVNVPNAKLWSPEEPNLYTLLIKTQHEGRFWEYIAYKIGIRTAEAGAPGTVGAQADIQNETTETQTGSTSGSPSVIFGKSATADLNGKGTLLINGRSFPFRFAENFRLSSYNPSGKDAASANLSELKSRGVNTILASCPLPEWFYKLCDEKGMFVISQADINTVGSGESRKTDGNPANDTTWLKSYIDRAEAVILTSQNHPSVIGFSLASGISNGYNLYESYIHAKNMLTEGGDFRPVIYKDAGGEWNTDAVMPNVASSNPAALAGRVVLEELTPKSAAFTVNDASKGIFALSGNLYFRTVDVKVSYTVRQGKKKVSQGVVSATLRPDAEAEITIPYGKAKPGSGPLSVELSVNIPSSNGSAATVTDTKEVAFP